MNDIPQVVFQNELLRRLPTQELSLLRPQLARVNLVASQVLQEAESPVDDVYFPESGLALLTADAGGHGPVEVAATGRDGFVGLAALLSPQPVSPHRILVLAPGWAYRLPARHLRWLTPSLPALHDLCLRHVETVLMQTSQIAACNARHEIPQRIARWLLTNLGRIDGNTLPITQELLSTILGVRRAGVSVAVSDLAAQGLVRQLRRRIEVLDPRRLEGAACTCRGIMQRSHTAIMNRPLPTTAGLACLPIELERTA